MKIFDLTNYLTIKGTNPPPPVFEGGNERFCNGIIIRADFHGYQIMVVSAFK